MQLSASLEESLSPVLALVPLDAAMAQLVVRTGATAEQISAVETVLRNPAIANRPYLEAGLWLYIDELDRSHNVSQGISDATGSYWHGIMHRREGDFGNSHYWFNRVGDHPAMQAIEGYEAHKFIDEVEAGADPDRLIAVQRAEWANLFAWCVEHYVDV